MRPLAYADRTAYLATNEKAYLACPRGDWLILAAAFARVPERTITAAAVARAREVLPLARKNDKRPL